MQVRAVCGGRPVPMSCRPVMVARWIRPFLAVAAAYDAALGAAFLVAFRPLLRAMEIPPPNHDAYLQFPAAVTLVFGIGFAMAARDPRGQRGIIGLGVLFKLAYALPILCHFAFGSIPGVWAALAFADLAFAVGLGAAWRATRR